MANKNDLLFELILGDSEEVEAFKSRHDELFSIINDNSDSMVVECYEREVSLSSFEDKYSVLMDIKIINLD